MALMIKLSSTCCSWTRSRWTRGKPSANCVRTETLLFAASVRARAITSRKTSKLRSSLRDKKSPPLIVHPCEHRALAKIVSSSLTRAKTRGRPARRLRRSRHRWRRGPRRREPRSGWRHSARSCGLQRRSGLRWGSSEAFIVSEPDGDPVAKGQSPKRRFAPSSRQTENLTHLIRGGSTASASNLVTTISVRLNNFGHSIMFDRRNGQVRTVAEPMSAVRARADPASTGADFRF